MKNNTKGWFNPRLMPFVAAFHNLPKPRQDEVVTTNRIGGFEKACNLLRLMRAAGYSRQKPA
jgi:hypothetical protein